MKTSVTYERPTVIKEYLREKIIPKLDEKKKKDFEDLLKRY